MANFKSTDIEDIYPLSPMQQGMLFHSLYSPETGMYADQFNCILEGDLDITAFEKAWNDVILRHAVLRTSFEWEDLEEPLQIVHREVEFRINQQDLRSLSRSVQEAALKAHLESDIDLGFNLNQAPLMRLALLRTGETAYRLVWSNHHILFDGWSLPLLLKEVLEHYEANQAGRVLYLKPARPFRDYIAFIRAQDLSKAEQFWREELSGFLSPTQLVIDELPNKRERSAHNDRGVDVVHALLDSQATQSLRKQAQQAGVTLNTVFQGAWGLLLSLYSSETDVLFGATVAGRPPALAGVESMLGLFINTLPVRMQIDPGQKVGDWLKSNQARQATMRQYEYTPLVNIQSWSQIPASQPLFRSILVFENYPVESTLKGRPGSLQIHDVNYHGKTNYPLTVVLEPGQGLDVQFVFDPAILDRAAMERMSSHFMNLLQSLASNPEKFLSEVTLLSEDDVRQIIQEINPSITQPADETPIPLLVHEGLTRQAGLNPQLPALRLVNNQGHVVDMSYAELDKISTQLAKQLLTRGVEAGTLIGVCLERSFEMIIALFGVLKAGGAYVPLDPKYPKDRLSFMVRDAGISILLTQQSLRELIPGQDASKPIQTICLDADWTTTDTGDDEQILPVVDSNQAANVIYTSGSTGQPKGVIVPHEALARHAQFMIKGMELELGSRISQWISLSFDAAAEEIFPALCSGATLVMADSSIETSGYSIVDMLKKQQMTHLHLATPVWHQVVDELSFRREQVPSSLKLVLVGGESPSIERLRLWQQASTHKHWFINAYGPTEATIACTMYKREIGPQSNWFDDIQRVPIGLPFDYARIYLVDAYGHHVPSGVSGEILIGGGGLAKGYLGQPALTETRFINNPMLNVLPALNQDPRVYCTGDLGRWLPEGGIEFIGRADHQVKLRGFRIELEEIESVLRNSEGIQEAVVILRQDKPGDARLVAYYENIPSNSVDGSKSNQNLRHRLAEKLPDYMLPAAFVLMNELPRLPNGKVNRRALAALPAPETEYQDTLEGEIIPPGNAEEEIIAGLWHEVLGVEAASVNINFFDLGGHSLKATQLLSRMRQVFKIELPLRSIFEAPTIAGMAAVVRSAIGQDSKKDEPIAVLTRDSQTGLPVIPPPLSFSQQRLWFLDQLDPGNTSYNIPAAVHIQGDLDISALELAISAVIQRHESLRTSFSSQVGVPVQMIAARVETSLPVIDVAMDAKDSESEQSQHLMELIRQEVQKPFNLATGPLARAILLRLQHDAGPVEFVLVFTLHHIVADGWSLGILVREVSELYFAYKNGLTVELPALDIQYADYAAWQRSWLNGAELDRQLAYWKAQLQGIPPLLDLPTDRPRPALKTSRGASISFQFPARLGQEIQELSRKEGVTTYMLLLAAFQILLFRYTGQEDICVGSAIANRTRPEIEKLIGFFVNTLVLRGDLSGEPNFRELLQQVRETSLGAFAHQDLPFEMLVEALQPERNLSYTPLFQVGFDWQEVPLKNKSLPDLELRPLDAHSGTAAYDLLMSINQSDAGIGGSLEYNTDLFDAQTVQRLLGHFEQILSHAIAEPDKPISRLPMLGEEERRILFVEWNQTEAPYQDNRVIHQLFEVHANSTPDASALIYRGLGPQDIQRLSYGELNQRANILARYLQTLGIGTETLVGISTERSIDMIVGILGVLKAGGAYLPLDPTYPADRLSYMLQDSKISVLLTQGRLRKQIDALLEETEDRSGEAIDKAPSQVQDQSNGWNPPTVVCIDQEWGNITQIVNDIHGAQSKNNLNTSVTKDNLAYIIYTSGSTGRPKGTLLRHQGLCNLVEWQRQTFEIDGQSRVLQFSPFSFDASVWETFMALANGATLVMAAQDVLSNGIELMRVFRDLDVTTVTLPPSFLSVIPEQIVSKPALPSLRTVIAAGEACTHEIISRWAPGRKFFNAYGPTETTVCASAALCDPDDPRDPSIGKPISNTRLYVLDKHLEPLPVGVPGELFIGGVGLARGYLNRPEMSADKFIPDPYIGYLRKFGMKVTPRDRLYRTGDLVRYRGDGNIEFLGRIDQQVKVRGFRIELGEIEAGLRQFEGLIGDDYPGRWCLRDVAVVVKEDTPGDKRLVAFVIPEQVGTESVSYKNASQENLAASAEELQQLGGSPSIEQSTSSPFQIALVNALTEHLRKRLPEYMLPSAYKVLDEMPLSPSGKVDRKALERMSMPSQGRERLQSVYEAPRNDGEKQLCVICAELLGISWSDPSPVSIHDNFFELGGHSLLATQFLARVREKFQVELPLRVLFENPTVAGMLPEIERLQRSGAAAAAPSIQRVSRDKHRMRQSTAGLSQLEVPDKRESDTE